MSVYLEKDQKFAYGSAYQKGGGGADYELLGSGGMWLYEM